MSLLAVGIGLLSMGAAGAAGYWMLNVNRRMIRLLDMQTLLRESQGTHFHHLNLAAEGILHDVHAVQDTMNALRAIHPEIDASLTVHHFLLKHEGEGETVVDLGQACEALRTLVQHQGIDSNTRLNPASTYQKIVTRLLLLLRSQKRPHYTRKNRVLRHFQWEVANRLA